MAIASSESSTTGQSDEGVVETQFIAGLAEMLLSGMRLKAEIANMPREEQNRRAREELARYRETYAALIAGRETPASVDVEGF